MRHKTTLLTAFILACLAISCTEQDRCVVNPLIETANTWAIDIVKVELSDTATILHTDAYYVPKFWIKISSDSYLLANDRKYALTDTRGIQADSLFWMPDSGEASFQLIFEPLPRNTKSFDFIESDSEDSFKIFGVDLTGKTAYCRPENIPAALLKEEGTNDPDPVMKSGESEISLHLPYYHKGLAKNADLYLNTILDGQQPYTSAIDPETGEASFKFRQYGPAHGIIMAGETSGEIWLAPGEKIDVYLDMRKSGQFIMKRRNDKWQYGEVEPMRSCYYTGTYGNLQTSIPGMRRYSMNVNSGNFARYDMTAEEYTENVISKYRSLSDSLAASSLPSQVKEMQRLALMQDAIYAMANGDFLREKNYRYVNDSWTPSQKPDIGLDPITAENRKELCKLIDITDRKLASENNITH